MWLWMRREWGVVRLAGTMMMGSILIPLFGSIVRRLRRRCVVGTVTPGGKVALSSISCATTMALRRLISGLASVLVLTSKERLCLKWLMVACCVGVAIERNR